MEQNGRDLNGQFAKGHTGFKKKNAPEFQRATREKLWNFFEEKIKELPEIFEKLSASNKARTLLTIAEFFLPKQKELFVEADVNNHGATIDYTKLSDATLREILAATNLSEDGTEV